MDKDSPVPNAFQAYWTAYGGARALLHSRYLWLSIGPGLLLWPAWRAAKSGGYAPWTDLALQIIPSVISFSLGALAIILSLSSGLFLKFIQQSGRPDSLFMKMIAVFFHFILVQFSALFFAILCRFIHYDLMSFMGFWLFIYALSCGIAAAANLVGLAQLKNKVASLKSSE